MKQTVCDRCRRVGGYADINWNALLGWHIFPVKKDLCEDCFKYLFPEWAEKESKI